MHPLLIPEGSDGKGHWGVSKDIPSFSFPFYECCFRPRPKWLGEAQLSCSRSRFFFVFHSMWERRTKRLCMGVALF